jgi:hypothetical protein
MKQNLIFLAYFPVGTHNYISFTSLAVSERKCKGCVTLLSYCTFILLHILLEDKLIQHGSSEKAVQDVCIHRSCKYHVFHSFKMSRNTYTWQHDSPVSRGDACSLVKFLQEHSNYVPAAVLRSGATLMIHTWL